MNVKIIIEKNIGNFIILLKEDGYCFDNSVVTGTPQIRTVVETCSKKVNTLENGTVTIQLESS